MSDVHEIYALKYAERSARRRGDSFLFDDDHAAPHPMDYFLWVIRSADRLMIVDTGYDAQEGARRGRPILRDPQPMSECDYLICESTYGGRVHEPPEQAKDRLAHVVGATARRGGKVIIPAFAVGRTQELVYRLDELTNEGRLPPIPVYVDSPLAVNVTDIFRAHPECYDRELLDYIESDPDPFGFARLTYIRDVEDSKRLNTSSLPMVVISASGMAEAGAQSSIS